MLKQFAIVVLAVLTARVIEKVAPPVFEWLLTRWLMLGAALSGALEPTERDVDRRNG